MFTDNSLLFFKCSTFKYISQNHTFTVTLGNMSDIPIFFFVVKYALPILNFRWNKIFVAFCVNTSFNFLFFQMLSPKICFSCTYCTNTLLYATDDDCGSVYFNFKGTICIVCCNCKLNCLAFSHDCNINLKF